jgi:site-specific DNA recombinase
VHIENEAKIVRRIFDDFNDGKTPREIANELNAEKVPPPRGRYWRASTINGNRQRSNGILQNSIYSGEIIWNRVRMVKDPSTGRRISRVNPKEAWIRNQVPELRIVPQDIFDTAQRRKSERGGPKPHQKRKPRHLFSGLLKCGVCGAGISMKDRDHGRVRVVCTQAKEAGTCTNKRPYYLDEIERTVLSGLKEELKNPEAIARYVLAYNDEMKRLSAASSSTLGKLENRLSKVEGELSRAIDAIVRGIVEPEDMRGRIANLKQEKQKIKTNLEGIQSSKSPVVLHPTAMASYCQCVDNLEQAIRTNSLHGSEESKNALGELVDSVIVYPRKMAKQE